MKLKIVGNISMKIKLNADQQATGIPDPFNAMIEVMEPGYIPEYVRLRAKIGDGAIIIADIPHAAFEKIDQDPKVSWVSTGATLSIPEE